MVRLKASRRCWLREYREENKGGIEEDIGRLALFTARGCKGDHEAGLDRVVPWGGLVLGLGVVAGGTLAW